MIVMTTKLLAKVLKSSDLSNHSCSAMNSVCVLGVTEDEAVSHRIYDLEIAEMSEDATFILLMPPVERVCSVPGCTEAARRNASPCTYLPIQVFEMSESITSQVIIQLTEPLILHRQQKPVHRQSKKYPPNT